jgi:hypothetical protein
MRREKTQISKIRNAKVAKQQTPRKSRESSETTLRTYIPIKFENLENGQISRYL